jgi:STIP1 family protein 1
VEMEYGDKIEELRGLFEVADLASDPMKRKPVPDWVVDDITFSVMVDPVVVSLPPLRQFIKGKC